MGASQPPARGRTSRASSSRPGAGHPARAPGTPQTPPGAASPTLHPGAPDWAPLGLGRCSGPPAPRAPPVQGVERRDAPALPRAPLPCRAALGSERLPAAPHAGAAPGAPSPLRLRLPRAAAAASPPLAPGSAHRPPRALPPLPRPLPAPCGSVSAAPSRARRASAAPPAAPPRQAPSPLGPPPAQREARPLPVPACGQLRAPAPGVGGRPGKEVAKVPAQGSLVPTCWRAGGLGLERGW